MKKTVLVLGLLLSGAIANAETAKGVGKYSSKAGGFESLLVDVRPFQDEGRYSGSMTLEVNRFAGIASITYEMSGSERKAVCGYFSLQRVSEDIFFSESNAIYVPPQVDFNSLREKPKDRLQFKGRCWVSQNGSSRRAANVMVEMSGNDFVLMVSQPSMNYGTNYGAQDFIKGHLTVNTFKSAK